MSCRWGGANSARFADNRMARWDRLEPDRCERNSADGMVGDAGVAWTRKASRAASRRPRSRASRAAEDRERNLLTDPAALMTEAPECATLVVFHTAVLVYVASKAHREQFAKAMRRSRAVWISNEVPGVFPDLAKAAPPASRRGLFLLAVNGSPVAWTGPHGESIDWFGA